MLKSIRIVVLAMIASFGALVGSAHGQFEAPDTNWNGIYFGGQIGLLAIKAHEKGPAIPAGETLLGDTGGNAGVFAGFHFQATDWLVWGLDVEFNSDATEYLYNGRRFGAMEWDAAVRTHIGVPVAPNVLAYGTAGYSWAHFDLSPYYRAARFSGEEHTSGGPQFGAGVDIMLTENIMTRLEATWAHYGVNTITSAGARAGTSEPSHVNVRIGLAAKM